MSKDVDQKKLLRMLPLIILAAALIVWICIPSKAEPNRYVPNAGDGEHTPTMATLDVSTFISDSGYTKYHITTPVWEMYEDAEEPFWKFPGGLELEQYDINLKPESTVICDSAIYLSRKRIWQLDGNVVMVNTQADSFLTQQLFWDQSRQKIYSDSFIHIVKTDRTIEGYGFESDQAMREYFVNQPTAILPSESMRPRTARTDSASPVTDSIKAPEPQPQQKAKSATPERSFDRPKGIRAGGSIEQDLAIPKK